MMRSLPTQQAWAADFAEIRGQRPESRSLVRRDQELGQDNRVWLNSPKDVLSGEQKRDRSV